MSELSERKGWEEGGGHIADNLNQEKYLLSFKEYDNFIDICGFGKREQIAWAKRCESIANKAIKRMIENANNKNKKISNTKSLAMMAVQKYAVIV